MKTQDITKENESSKDIAAMLFAAVLKIPDDPSQVVRIFNDSLARYGRYETVTLAQMTALANRQGSDEVRIWLLCSCVDVLQLYHVNPCPTIPPGVVFRYWVYPRLKSLHPSDAIRRFLQEFELDRDTHLDVIITAAVEAYIQKIPPDDCFIIDHFIE